MTPHVYGKVAQVVMLWPLEAVVLGDLVEGSRMGDDALVELENLLLCERATVLRMGPYRHSDTEGLSTEAPTRPWRQEGRGLARPTR